MRKVLIGCSRSKGNFKEGKRTIKFDNIKLFLADYRHVKDHGFTFGKNVEPVKIRTDLFSDVAGVNFKDFLKNFERKYMFHKISVIGEENDYGRFEVSEVKFSKDNCFELWRQLQEADEDDIPEPEDEEDDEYDDPDEDDDDDEENDDDVEDPFGFDFIDTGTGEVGMKKSEELVEKEKKGR